MERTFFEWVVFIVGEYYPLFLRGMKNTLIIAIVGTIIGFLIGLIVAIARSIEVTKQDPFIKRAGIKALRWILGAYIEIFRSTPMIVQSMVIYYGIRQYFGLSMNELVAGILIISINTGAYMAEIVRGGILSIDAGQTEAAQSIGMTYWQSMFHVVLPQAIRNIMPSIGNEFIINIKDSSVLNVISVAELYFMAKSAAGTYLRYFEVFFVVAVIYFILTYTVTRILRAIEKKMDGSDTYVIHGSQSNSRAAIKIEKRERTRW